MESGVRAGLFFKMKSCHRVDHAIRIWSGANKIAEFIATPRGTLRPRGNIMRKCSFGFSVYGADRNSYHVYVYSPFPPLSAEKAWRRD